MHLANFLSHTFEIRALTDDTGWEYSFDNSSTYIQVTTTILGSTTAQYPVVAVETSGAAAKNMDIFCGLWKQVLSSSSMIVVKRKTQKGVNIIRKNGSTNFQQAN